MIKVNTKSTRQQKRVAAILPEGHPKYTRAYDNGGESFDRYTVVFTGRYRHKTSRQCVYVAMSANPFHPQGFGQHGESDIAPDTNKWGFAPTYGRKCGLGTRIRFTDLPPDCQAFVLMDYVDLWDLYPVKTVSPFMKYTLSLTMSYDWQTNGNWAGDLNYQTREETKKAAKRLIRNCERLSWPVVLGLIIIKNY